MLGIGMAMRPPKAQSYITRAISLLTSSAPGAWYDPSDLTATKAAYRRNLLTETEFRNGVTDAITRGGLVSATTLSGYAGALAIGYDGAIPTYAYKTITHTNGVTYTLSVRVKMDDGLPPVFSLTPSLNTFALVLFGIALTGVDPATVSVSANADGTYTVAYTSVSTGASVNFGVVKYQSNNNRTFKVTGYQLEAGSSASAYQKITDYYTEFLQAFPDTALFQDSTGTTPVTAVEQPVGLVLDKSKGLVLGAELVTNGDFSGGLTGWTQINDGTAVISVSGGSVLMQAPTVGAIARLRQSFAVVVGKTYKISIGSAANFSSTSFISFGVSGGGEEYGKVTTSGASQRYFTATSSTLWVSAYNGAVGVDMSYDNISVRELPGNHLIQPTATSRPTLKQDGNGLYYLNFDGVDDSLYSAASIDFTSTDKMTVFAGVHKASDVIDQSTIVETGPGSNITAGTYALQASLGGTTVYRAQLYGSSRGVRDTPATFAAPRTDVISIAFDIAGSAITDEIVFRSNGAAPAGMQNILSPSGTGNFSNYPLYVGRRNNAALPFNGRIYQLALKGKSMTAAEIATVESFVNLKTKAY